MIFYYSYITDEHILLVDNVIKRQHSLGVSINFGKSIFAKEEIEFLEHRINKDRILPIFSKLETYTSYTLKTKKQLQRLLGFINWFRPFIKNLSILTADVYTKLKSEKKTITWSEVDRQKIHKIFSEIKNHGILHHPDFNKEFTLRCDASDVGMGSILLQNRKVIGFYSKKYNNRAKLHNNEKEMYAILKISRTLQAANI
ncbi:Retrovirus-related Pol polyprotein from transposon 17.6 [Dictyocoela muelleri]|nr:Retrovirus-related Pol polyprotein from transposon 17.6 [Dictyocoela muelleri]